MFLAVRTYAWSDVTQWFEVELTSPQYVKNTNHAAKVSDPHLFHSDPDPGFWKGMRIRLRIRIRIQALLIRMKHEKKNFHSVF
jgi:hypothetical protein